MLLIKPLETFLEFVEEFGQSNELLNTEGKKKLTKLKNKLANKKLQEKDSPMTLLGKGFIRRGEARAGARFCGLDDSKIHFLDLPFYETGATRKKPLGEEDITIISNLMEKIKPHQVFAAGDLADPHGTHRVCLDAILGAFKNLKKKKWIKDCWLWLYRGAWHEFAIDEIEMAVPISPQELYRKRKAIFMHQSQKDSPPFPGDDEREFWVRAEDRNRETAIKYRNLGLAEYEAIEAFRRWKFD
jgi:glucosamine-6-phosphate deaminase